MINRERDLIPQESVTAAGSGSIGAGAEGWGLERLELWAGAFVGSPEDEVLGLDGADKGGNPWSKSFCNKGWGSFETLACNVWRAPSSSRIREVR